MRKLSDWLKDRSAAAIHVAGIVPAVVQALGDSWATPRPAERTTPRERKRHSELAIGAVALGLIFLVAWIDTHTSPRVSFSLFYLLIVTFAAWSGGKRAGVFCAFTSSFR